MSLKQLLKTQSKKYINISNFKLLLLLQVLANYKDFELFVGEKDEEEKGMIALLNFREDGITPYMLFVCDGLIEEKVVSFFYVRFCPINAFFFSETKFALSIFIRSRLITFHVLRY